MIDETSQSITNFSNTKIANIIIWNECRRKPQIEYYYKNPNWVIGYKKLSNNIQFHGLFLNKQNLIDIEYNLRNLYHSI